TALPSKARETSAAIAGCVRAPRRPRQSLDRVPTPAGKTRRHDRRPPRPDCFRPGATRTHLSKRDRKLLHRASRLRLEPGIHLVKGSLAARLQFPVKLRSQRSEEHTSELQSLTNLVCRLLL